MSDVRPSPALPADPPVSETPAPEPPRRRFLKQTGAVSMAAVLAELGDPEPAQACSVPITGAGWPSVNGWEHRTLMHFLNAVFPGNDNQALFTGDGYRLRSGGDTSAGAWAACALDVLYDPYFGVAGTQSNLLATALDWVMRVNFFDTYFYKGTQSEQLRAIDQAMSLDSGIQDAVNLTLAAVLGAAKNYSVPALLGWPGPNGGYWSGSRHPLWRWLQPTRLTVDGNLP